MHEDGLLEVLSFYTFIVLNLLVQKETNTNIFMNSKLSFIFNL